MYIYAFIRDFVFIMSLLHCMQNNWAFKMSRSGILWTKKFTEIGLLLDPPKMLDFREFHLGVSS